MDLKAISQQRWSLQDKLPCRNHDTSCCMIYLAIIMIRLILTISHDRDTSFPGIGSRNHCQNLFGDFVLDTLLNCWSKYCPKIKKNVITAPGLGGTLLLPLLLFLLPPQEVAHPDHGQVRFQSARALITSQNAKAHATFEKALKGSPFLKCVGSIWALSI